MHLYLVRHGECLGQCDPAHYSEPDSPLSTSGREQAERTAEQLGSRGFTHVLSSPLVRSLETASIISKKGQPNSFDVWSELREGFSSHHRGLGAAELHSRFSTAALPADITDMGWAHGGNTYKNWYPRCRSVLDKLEVYSSDDNHIVLVTHGGFANYLLHAVMGISFQTPLWFELANCSISIVRFVVDPEKERPNWPLYPPVRVEVLSINDTAHLAALPL